MSDYKFFDRRYIMDFGQPGSIGYTAGGDQIPLHVSFSFQKSDASACNTGKIDIWNLADQQIAALEKKNCYLTFSAGYPGTVTRVFEGDVSFSSTTISGGDRKTHIEVIDGLQKTSDTYVSISYKGTVNWKKIIDDTVGKMGMPVTYSKNVKNMYDVYNGFSFIGMAKDLFDRACKCNRLTWSIQNGYLHIKQPWEYVLDSTYEISAESGLIGYPEKVTLTKEAVASENLIGWDTKMFLNAFIDTDMKVILRSKMVSGVFYVKSVEHTGDNFSGDWMTSARLIQEDVSSGIAARGSGKGNRVSLVN